MAKNMRNKEFENSNVGGENALGFFERFYKHYRALVCVVLILLIVLFYYFTELIKIFMVTALLLLRFPQLVVHML